MNIQFLPQVVCACNNTFVSNYIYRKIDKYKYTNPWPKNYTYSKRKAFEMLNIIEYVLSVV